MKWKKKNTTLSDKAWRKILIVTWLGVFSLIGFWAMVIRLFYLIFN